MSLLSLLWEEDRLKHDYGIGFWNRVDSIFYCIFLSQRGKLILINKFNILIQNRVSNKKVSDFFIDGTIGQD